MGKQRAGERSHDGFLTPDGWMDGWTDGLYQSRSRVTDTAVLGVDRRLVEELFGKESAARITLLNGRKS